MKKTPPKMLLLLPLSGVLDDCKPSGYLFELLNLDPHHLIEQLVYEWGLYLAGRQIYQRHDGWRAPPQTVLEETYRRLLYDEFDPRMTPTQRRELKELVDAVGWRALGVLSGYLTWLGGEPVTSIEGWCDDNLIVRILPS